MRRWGWKRPKHRAGQPAAAAGAEDDAGEAAAPGSCWEDFAEQQKARKRRLQGKDGAQKKGTGQEVSGWEVKVKSRSGSLRSGFGPSHKSQPVPGKAQQVSLPPPRCATLSCPRETGGNAVFFPTSSYCICMLPGPPARHTSPPPSCCSGRGARPRLGRARPVRSASHLLPVSRALLPSSLSSASSIGHDSLLSSPPSSPPSVGSLRLFSATLATELLLSHL